MKKKIVSICSLLTILAIFFCVPVYAVSWKGSASDTDQVGDVIMDTHVYALDYEDYANTNHPYKFYLYVTVRLQNIDSDEPAYMSIPRFTISPGDGVNSSYLSIESYSADLSLSVDGGIITISPSDDFSYSNGIVVPPNTSLYAVGKVELSASTFTWTPSVVNATFTSTTSDVYNYGTAVDYSPIITYLQNAANHTDVNNVLTVLSQFYLRNHDELQQVINTLGSIYNNVTYSGSNYNVDFSSYNRFQSFGADPTLSSTYYKMERVIFPSYYVNNDIEINSSSDQIIHSGTKCIPVMFSFTFINQTNSNIRANAGIRINNLYPANIYNSVYSAEVTYYSSNFYDFVNPYSYYYVDFQAKHTFVDHSGNYSIVPKARITMFIMYNLYIRDDVSLTFSDPTYSMGTLTTTSEYAPIDEYSILKDIYLGFLSNNQQNNDTVSESNSAGTMSDQIHQQEQQWYAQNDAAMEAVGLSNYRYTQNQQNGIVGAVLQFEQLWQALGDWTLVYIFTLMLSLAVFILRHEPTTRVKQMREMYMTDRAVARDWEMRTDPAKFSHRRWVENERRR